MSSVHPPADCPLTYRVRNGGWLLTSDWPYVIMPEATRLTVPKGFQCDLASIPRPLIVLCPKETLGVAGPVLHDAVYRGVVGRGNGVRLTRRRTDRLFYALMRCDGVPRWKAGVAFAAVRLFGCFAWRRLPGREDAIRLAS